MGQSGGVRSHQINRQARHLGLPQIQPHRGHSHNSAAAFAVIDWVLYTASASGLNGAHAGVSWGPPGVQLWNIQQPTELKIRFSRKIEELGFIPFLIGLGDIIGVRCHDAPHTAPGFTRQKAVGGEQGHLGVIGNPAKAILKLVFFNTVFAVSEKNGLFRQKSTA